ncbi:MAG: ribonuclease BN [Pyrobaculum sp.]
MAIYKIIFKFVAMADVLSEQVLKDLQSRGFKILEKIGERLYVVEKKGKHLVYIMIEGVEVGASTLLNLINMAEMLSMQMVLALVSSDGTVTYYFVRRIRLPHNIHHVENI